jgi:hypothetical protein
MPQPPGFTAHEQPPRALGAELVEALAQLLVHNNRFLDTLHQARPLVFRGTVTATQTTNGVRQVQVQRAGQVQADGYWYPIYDAGYTATVGDDVLLLYTDRRMSACVIGARTMTSPAATSLATSSAGESYLTLTVTNNATTSIGGSTLTPVPASSMDYVVQAHLTGSTATQVWNALSDQSSFTDVKVLFQGTEIDADLDTQTNGAWSSSTQTFWFKLQRPIAAGGSDYYQLRVGGGLRTGPPRSWANIYPFSDDFPGASLSSSWSALNSPTVSVSGSVATISSTAATNNQAVRTVATIPAGYEMRYRAIQQGGSSNVCESIAQLRTLPSSGTPYFQMPAYGGSIFASADNGTTSWTSSSRATDGSYHVSALARDSSGNLYASLYGDAYQSSTTNGTFTTAVPFMLFPAQSGGAVAAQIQVDWVKQRPYVSPEPTVTASGVLQSAGGVRWEPIGDTSGSMLVDSTGAPVMALAPYT